MVGEGCAQKGDEPTGARPRVGETELSPQKRILWKERTGWVWLEETQESFGTRV